MPATAPGGSAQRRSLNELFQGIIRRPWLANGVHRLLSSRQGIGDSFIGIIGQ